MYGIAGHALLQLKVHVLACTIEDTVMNFFNSFFTVLLYTLCKLMLTVTVAMTVAFLTLSEEFTVSQK